MKTVIKQLPRDGMSEDYPLEMEMSKNDKTLQKVISDNEQDLAALEEWWGEVTPGEKVAVLQRISRMPDSGPDAVIARLAQLKFGEMIESRGW